MRNTIDIPGTFSGPLDLLLYLIRRDEMDIYDIHIGRLATSYLEEMEKLELVDVDEAAEFLDLASRLLEIKSRMLMPAEEHPGDAEEEEDNFDPRAGLVESLLEYRRFKDAAKMLGEMAEEQARRYPRIAPRFEFQLMEDAPVADSMDLMQAFQNLLIRMLPQADSNTITYTEIPTHVRVEQIETVLKQIESTRFSKLLSSAPNRQEMVGFFIAMLEMIRQRKVTARQTDDFSDIILERREPPVIVAAGKPAAQFVRCRLTRCFLDWRPAAKFFAEEKRITPAVAVFPCPAPARGKLAKTRKYVVMAFP